MYSPPLNVKLPDINLPTFDGNYSSWITFRDIFTAIVIDNKQLSGISKFFYLNSSLQGEPKACISNLPASEVNFTVASNILLDRYDNVRLIATDRIQRLFSPPTLDPRSHTSLRHLLDYFTSNVHALEALDLPVSLDKLLLSQLLLNNLNLQLISDWEAESIVDTGPSFEDLLVFLEKKCKILELSSTNPIVSNNGIANQQTISPKNTFSQAVKQNMCPLCKQTHFLYSCQQFRSWSVQESHDFVKKHCVLIALNQTHHLTLAPSLAVNNVEDFIILCFMLLKTQVQALTIVLKLKLTQFEHIIISIHANLSNPIQRKVIMLRVGMLMPIIN